MGDFANVEGLLRAQGVEYIRDRFRIPSRPQLSPAAALFACAAAAFLLSAGAAAASFLLGTAGVALLLLDACGFAPLAWAGPKETRTILIVPGTPAEEKEKPLFFALPLRCRLTRAGYFSRAEEVRRIVSAGVVALAFLLCTVSAGVLLLVLPPVPVFGAVAGVALLALAAWEWIRPAATGGPENVAAGWADRLAFPPGARFRPHLLVYSGDPAEVKYFLARYRGPLFRGRGVFLEFPREAIGSPAASVREGPFFSCRVDPALLSLVREAGKRHGVPAARDAVLREKSPGLFAMARGFSAVTLFPLASPPGPDLPFPAETAAGWAEGIAAAACAGGRGKGSVPDL